MQLAACAGDWAYVLLNTGYFIYIYDILIPLKLKNKDGKSRQMTLGIVVMLLLTSCVGLLC